MFKFQEEGKETPQKKIKTRAKTKLGKKIACSDGART